jgi:hypothetical protein
MAYLSLAAAFAGLVAALASDALGLLLCAQAVMFMLAAVY